jgi:hypothetical protein
VARTCSFATTVMTDPTELADSPDKENPTGWISLLRVEYTMALHILDEEREPFGQDSADHNVYTLAG